MISALTEEFKFNLFCYKIAKGNTLLAFTCVKEAFSIKNSASIDLKNRCHNLVTALGLITRVTLLCLPVINRITSNFAQKGSPDVLLGIIEKNGMLLKYLPESNRKRMNIVLAAIKQNPQALQFVHRSIIPVILRENGLALKFVSEELRNCIYIVGPAVEQNGLALEFASEDLRNNEEIVYTAVRQNGLALEFASEDLRNNEEIVCAAVEQNGLAIRFASEELKGNENVAILAVTENGLAWELLPRSLHEKETIVNAATQSNELVKELVANMQINL